MNEYEIDHIGTRFPVCPKCGQERVDWWGWWGLKHDGDTTTLQCNRCENYFTVTLHVETSFDTQ